MKFLYTIVSFLWSIGAHAQNMPTSLQVTLGGALFDGYGASQKPIFFENNEFFLITNSSSDASGTKTENSRGFEDLWITKLDENHIPIWDKTIGSTEGDFFSDVVLIDDFVFVLAESVGGISADKTAGNYGPVGTSTDLWLLCLDQDGNILFQEGYGGTGGESFSQLIQYTDTSLLIVCNSNSAPSGNKTTENVGLTDLWVVEVSALNGQIIQQKGIGSDGYDTYPTIAKSSSDNFTYITCESSGGISGDKTEANYGQSDIWMVQLDENLSVVRDKTLGGSFTEIPSRDNLIVLENEIYMCGWSFSGVSGNKSANNMGLVQYSCDYWLVKLDSELNILWDKVYGGGGLDFANSLLLNANGRLVLGGSSKSGASGNKTMPNFNTNGSANPTFDGWLLVLDSDGNILTQSAHGGGNDDDSFFFQYGNSAGDLLLASKSSSPISGNKTVGTYGYDDVWLAKIDASEFLNITEFGATTTMSVYPNPFTDQVRFQFEESLEPFTISLFSLDGKIIFEKLYPSGTQQLDIEIPSNYKMLIFEVKNEQIYKTGKLVKK